MTDSKNPTNLRLRKIGSVVKDTVWTIKDEQERPLAEIHYGKFSADKYSVRLCNTVLDTFIMADFDNPCELNTLQEAAELVDAWLHCNAVEYFANIKHSGEQAVVVPEPTHDEFMALAESSRIHGDLVDFMAGAAAYGLWLRGKIRTIPANRELGEGMVAADREEWDAVQAFASVWFAGRPDGEVHDASSAWHSRRQALRANQGGAAK